MKRLTATLNLGKKNDDDNYIAIKSALSPNTTIADCWAIGLWLENSSHWHGNEHSLSQLSWDRSTVLVLQKRLHLATESVQQEDQGGIMSH